MLGHLIYISVSASLHSTVSNFSSYPFMYDTCLLLYVDPGGAVE